MLTIKDLLDANEDNIKRINTPNNNTIKKQKALIFEKSLAHKDDLIIIQDCILATKEHRGYHALSVGSIIVVGYPNVELYTMHNTTHWIPVIDWCMDNDIRVISMSIATTYTEERDLALKKYTEWGGLVMCASGNWEDRSVSYPADSKYSIGVSATNSEDTNGPEVDITVDSQWSAKRYNRDSFASFGGTSGATPVVSGIALQYLNANPNGNLDSFRKWLKSNSIDSIESIHYTHSYGYLEEGERYFVYPEDLKDTLLPEPVKLILTIGSGIAILNEKEFRLRVAPFLKSYSDEYSATCMEIRPILEALGYKVDWDDKTEVVYIYK